MPEIEYHDELFPEIWVKNKLKFLVRDHLLKIANAFIKSIDIKKFKVHDVILTGSIANYNWNEKSDIDVHIMIDFADLKDTPETLRLLFDSKKSLWGKEHDITIKNHPVELYIEDLNGSTTGSGGRFSLLHDKWVKRPKHIDNTLDDKDPHVLKKVIDKLGQLGAILSEKRYDDLEKFLNSIYDMRQEGLDHEGGEFSPENLAFKILRNHGVMEKVKDIMRGLEDEELTLETDLS